MRFFQYALLACFIFGVIAEEDEEDENGGADGGSFNAKLQGGPNKAPNPAGNPAEESPTESAKPPGNIGEIRPEQTGANGTTGIKQQRGKGWRSRRSRCSFTPEQTNCAGSRFLPRWWFNPQTQMCQSFQFPVCGAKAAAFLTCKSCMQRCLKDKKGQAKTNWIKKVCPKKS
ncbi:anticoagulant protein rhipilin-1-like [Dermacentor variabilis]|uniref:anticoagulant protein rhipilin-1-like n=1 Tax=Dermacentor variabilis TaxID=34621 RepID=UPI003F5C7328